MRLFVGEYVSGGGLVRHPLDEIPSGLRMEGEAMLRAIVSDLSQVAATVVPLDSRFHIELDAGETFDTNPEQSVWTDWVAAAAECDAALIVAPESNGILAKGVAMLRAAGVDVIAGSGDFLRVASDKLQTAKVMLGAGVAHPMYVALSDRKFEREVEDCDRFVLKPRDGCGTQEIQTFDRYQDARAELTDDLILQPWMPGRAISVALVASNQNQTFLPAVSQTLREDGTCEYAGGLGPLDDDSQRRAAALASRAIAAMPPTARGFVGLDLLLGDRPSEDCVIEINPRLTTSYVGLRQMIQGNLAARLFDLETGPVTCNVTTESVRWTQDGKVWVGDKVADLT